MVVIFTLQLQYITSCGVSLPENKNSKLLYIESQSWFLDSNATSFSVFIRLSYFNGNFSPNGALKTYLGLQR